jgi:hypothetical protein
MTMSEYQNLIEQERAALIVGGGVRQCLRPFMPGHEGHTDGVTGPCHLSPPCPRDDHSHLTAAGMECFDEPNPHLARKCGECGAEVGEQCRHSDGGICTSRTLDEASARSARRAEDMSAHGVPEVEQQQPAEGGFLIPETLRAELLAVERITAKMPTETATDEVRLPKVPPGTVALIGSHTRTRWTPLSPGEYSYWKDLSGVRRTLNFGELLYLEDGKVTPEFGRVPRRWSAIEPAPDDLEAVKTGEHGEIYRRDPAEPDEWVTDRGYRCEWGLLREVDLIEVLDTP